MATINSDAVATDQIKAFVERIMRLREEERAIKGDIREVYAEAKGNGFDKTILGKLVNYVEKRESSAGELAEREALFDLYLTAYDSAGKTGTAVATHMHEADPEHDPETGEIIEITHPRHGAGGAEDEAAVATVAAPSSAQPTSLQKVQTTHPQHEAEEAGGEATAASPSDTQSEPAAPADSDGGIVASALVATHPVEGTTPTSTADGDRSGQVPPPSQPAPVVPSTYPEPGIVVMERCPPEGVVEHPFARCWPVNSVDVTGGVRQPIVKQGKFILDGRGRFYAARDAGIEYPVVQYEGTDPLGDVIRWNLASRNPSEKQRKVIAEKLAKIEPSRADEVMQLFGLHLEAAE